MNRSRRNVTSVRNSSEDQTEVNPLIPEGSYLARCVSYKLFTAWGEPKLELLFQITDLGAYFETNVSRYYTVKRLSKKGGFKPMTRTCGLMIEWFRCHPETPRSQRHDRLPMTKWLDGEYRIEVATVTKNFRQQSLPAQLQYSRVREILGRAS